MTWTIEATNRHPELGPKFVLTPSNAEDTAFQFDDYSDIPGVTAVLSDPHTMVHQFFDLPDVNSSALVFVSGDVELTVVLPFSKARLLAILNDDGDPAPVPPASSDGRIVVCDNTLRLVPDGG